MTVKTIVVTTSAQLNAALKSATGGETIVLSGSHKFTLTATDLNPPSKVTITSINPDAMSTIATASITRSSNIVIDSVKFDSSGVARADYLNDLNIANSSNIALLNSVMTGTARAFNDGTALVADNAISILDSTGLVVAGNVIKNYYTGLYAHRSSNVALEGNELTKMQGDGMQFSAMNKLTIKDNYIHDFLGSAHALNHDDMIQFWTAGSTTPSKNITITGNTLDSGTGSASQGIFFGNDVVRANPAITSMYYQNVVIDNNLVRNGEGNGIAAYYVNGLRITNNVVLYDHDAAAKGYNTNNIAIQVAGNAVNAIVSNNMSDAYLLPSYVTQSNNLRLPRDALGSSIVLSSHYPNKTPPLVDVDKPSAPAPTAPALPSTGTKTGTQTADTFVGTAANDGYRGNGGDDRINGNGGNDILYGDGGNDTIDGGAGDDKLYGGAGNDVIRGGTGNDTIAGDDGSDVLYGDDGDDRIDGGLGNDGVRGGNGKDLIYGGAGNDTIHGEAGDDLLYGDDGDDTIHGGDGNDGIRGGLGSDTIRGGNGGDVILGEAGNDKLFGEAGGDIIEGGDGSDWLHGGAGRDTLTGGAGQDMFVLDAPPEGGGDVVADFVAGQDKIVLDTSVFAALAGKTLTSAMFRSGSMAQDANDYLLYRNGVLYYDVDGNGAKAAVAIATLSNRAALTVQSLSLTDGTDAATLATSASQATAAANVTSEAAPTPEKSLSSATIQGTSQSDNMIGTSAANVLHGHGGNDVLQGKGGSDWLHGGAGADTLTGGLGTDYFAFDSPFDGTIDRIVDFSPLDRIVLDTEIFMALAGNSKVAGSLTMGKVAQDANDHLLFHQGILSYDPDGNGPEAARAFATLNPGATPTASSFLLI